MVYLCYSNVSPSGFFAIGLGDDVFFIVGWGHPPIKSFRCVGTRTDAKQEEYDFDDESETALHHVKKMIKKWKREQEEYDFDDDFDFPF
jgi:hypothetical protein